MALSRDIPSYARCSLLVFLKLNFPAEKPRSNQIGMYICYCQLFLLLLLLLMWTIFKVFTERVTILLLFSALCFFGPGGMWDLSSPTRDLTSAPCTARRSVNQWTTREVPHCELLIGKGQER